ncbi:MAG: hypothetical protein JWP04_2330 [Belnapia sp.]|nr:hypothetical protein [Belnapia sp.]
MQTGYFIVLLIGFAWLALWSVQPKPSSKKDWWPFDMRADLDSTANAAPAEARPGQWQGAAARSRAASPQAPAAEAAPGVEPDSAPSPPADQAAWRQRRDQTSSVQRRSGR